jgi:hypothetical protein
MPHSLNVLHGMLQGCLYMSFKMFAKGTDKVIQMIFSADVIFFKVWQNDGKCLSS